MDDRPDAPASDNLLQAVFAASDDAIFEVDSSGVIARCNASAERIFGLPASELTGGVAVELFAEHRRVDVGAALESVRSGHPVFHYEAEVGRSDRAPVPVSLSAVPTGAGVVALVLRDITERQITQATLAELETRLREHEAVTHVGVWLWDVATGAVQWTEELHRIHAVEPLEFEGTLEAHLAHVHADDRDRLAGLLRAAVVSGDLVECDYRIVRPDGSVRSLHTRATPTADSAGTVVGLCGIAMDVTDEA